MVKVRAYIKLYEDGRKTAFHNGYRPLFNFLGEMKISGEIYLFDKIEFCPGEEGEVEISFLSSKYLGEDFGIGKKFTFGEGVDPLGEGEIKEIYPAHAR